jgi:hypothetical protein
MAFIWVDVSKAAGSLRFRIVPGALERVKTALRRYAVLTRPARSQCWHLPERHGILFGPSLFLPGTVGAGPVRRRSPIIGLTSDQVVQQFAGSDPIEGTGRETVHAADTEIVLLDVDANDTAGFKVQIDVGICETLAWFGIRQA